MPSQETMAGNNRLLGIMCQNSIRYLLVSNFSPSPDIFLLTVNSSMMLDIFALWRILNSFLASKLMMLSLELASRSVTFSLGPSLCSFHSSWVSSAVVQMAWSLQMFFSQFRCSLQLSWGNRVVVVLTITCTPPSREVGCPPQLCTKGPWIEGVEITRERAAVAESAFFSLA